MDPIGLWDESILEAISDAFVALDEHAVITYVNHQAEKLMGRPRAGLIGGNLWELFPELKGSRMEGEYRRAMDERVPVEFEEQYPGRRAWVEIRAYPAGRGLAVYYRDVTRRHQLEEGQQAMLAMASHDLRNPLFVMAAGATLLKEHVAGGQPDPERLLAGLERIERAGGQMIRVVDELVDLVQIQAGRELILAVQETDLVALAGRMIEIHQFGTESQSLVLAAAASSVVGWWDEPRLERVVSNLLTNAIKYSPEQGAIEVSVGEEIDPAGRRWAVLSVADHGMGIPAKDLPHIFDRFYRAHNVGRIPGSGVGLAAARHIVERHGGLISVESHEGKGATFTVRLPIKDGRPACG